MSDKKNNFEVPLKETSFNGTSYKQLFISRYCMYIFYFLFNIFYFIYENQYYLVKSIKRVSCII